MSYSGVKLVYSASMLQLICTDTWLPMPMVYSSVSFTGVTDRTPGFIL